MQINQGCFSHIGRRQNQQDAYAFSDFEDTIFIGHGGVMAIVCDGMGGLERGDEASCVAVKTLLEFYMAKTPEQSIPEMLDQAIHKANDAIAKLGLETCGLGSIGTTLVVAVIYKGELLWRSVGDSRIYLYRNNQLNQLSVDHTYEQELLQSLKTNGLSTEEATNHPDSNALVSYLGIGNQLQINSNEHPMKLLNDDVLLICTDGLYNALNCDEITEALQNSDAMRAAKDLQHKTVDKQILKQDNLTGIVLRLENGKCNKPFFSLKVRSPYWISLCIVLLGYSLKWLV